MLAYRLFAFQGVRVEVNGQVLSQGGNLGADRITDTTSAMQASLWQPALAACIRIVHAMPHKPYSVCRCGWLIRTAAYLQQSVLQQNGNSWGYTTANHRLQVRSNPDFLPAAVIVGLEPGVPLQVCSGLLALSDALDCATAGFGTASPDTFV